MVSANCISQLGLVPGHSLPVAEKDRDLPDRCAKAAARRHLDRLAQRTGVRILLADAERLNVAPGGKVIKRESLSSRYGLMKSDRPWRWDLARSPSGRRISSACTKWGPGSTSKICAAGLTRINRNFFDQHEMVGSALVAGPRLTKAARPQGAALQKQSHAKR